MCRPDAERALIHLRGKDVMGYEMRLGWGKAVNIPTFPVYVPPRLAAMLEPPPHLGKLCAGLILCLLVTYELCLHGGASVR